MKTSILSIALSAALSFIASCPVTAAPSASQTCKKMVAEGRDGGLGLSACLCNYRVIEVVADEDLKFLIFDSMHNGTDVSKAVKRLPKQSRIRKQKRTM